MPTLGEYSEVAICNLALQEIGRGMMITALDENSQAARACRLRYPYARDATLRGYDWNFASARAELAALSDPPAFGFANQYELPADCLRVRAIENGEADDWRVEGRRILTDMGAPIFVKYTARVTDPAQFDPLFVAALAARVAADIAVSLSESTSKAQGLWQIYLGKLHEAWKNDAIEGQPDALPQGSWVGARFGQNIRPYSDWDPNF
ncbi:MAG: hypothetical protein GC190_21050 [Alphaproteobacteria bacterium]|nr:hypothetical protein [Alphaproteobacteria bacterium]